jgi:putative salt-induced outer membrane protein
MDPISRSTRTAATARIAFGCIVVCLAPSVAAADQSSQPTAPETEPAGTVGAQAPATTGTTEVEGSGKFASAAAVEEAAATDATEFNLGAGGLLSTGNARAGSATGTTNLRIRRQNHQFSAAFAANYGRAAPDAASDVQTTVHNEQGRVRYDYFVHPRISVFAMLTARHDPFQGLEARVNVDPGVAFYLVNDKRNRLWTEVGYDFQFDRFTEVATYAKDETGAVVLDAEGNPIVAIERQRTNHAARLFGGYANNISAAAMFSTGIEYLQSVQIAERWRVNWDVALTTQLVNRLAISFTFTARMDNDPAPGIRKVDTITAVSLICTIF